MKRKTQRISLFSATLIALTAKLALAAPAPEVLEFQQQRIEAIERASAATVAVFAKGGKGGGSAVVISPDGYALSNFHVTKPVGNWLKCGMNDGVLYDAVIVGIDPTGDVALIKLLGRDDFPHAEMVDSDKVRVGDYCFAAGNPFLLANDYHPTVTWGVVSGTHRYQYPAGTLLEYADCIQTDAAINPGNSGGPLVDAQGRLIGINGRGSFEKRGRVNVGVGYAISINQIKNFLGYLKSGRVVDHATLGAVVSSHEDGRVLVSDILENSDAYRRGLRYDSEIVSFGGRKITTVNGFKNVLGIYPRAWRVPITFIRDGQKIETLVRLSGVHPQGELDKLVAGGPQKVPGHDPEPQPGEKEGEDSDSEDKPKPKLPDAIKRMLGKKPKMPKIVKDHYEEKPRFVNYYFNRTNQERVWNRFVEGGSFDGIGPEWTASGELTGGGDVELSLTPTLGTITFPVGESKAQFGDDLHEDLSPPASGGLLQALHIWQRLLTVGPEKFGNVYYLGTVPMPTRPGLMDVLVGVYGGMETRFFFHPTTGHLVGLEMFVDDYSDPCEIYFGEYREVEGRHMPHRLEIRHGDTTFADVQIDQYEFESTME